MPIDIGKVPQQIAQSNTEAFLLTNNGPGNLYLGRSASVSPTSSELYLARGGNVSWRAKEALWGVSDTLASVGQLYTAGASATPGPSQVGLAPGTSLSGGLTRLYYLNGNTGATVDTDYLDATQYASLVITLEGVQVSGNDANIPISMVRVYWDDELSYDTPSERFAVMPTSLFTGSVVVGTPSRLTLPVAGRRVRVIVDGNSIAQHRVTVSGSPLSLPRSLSLGNWTAKTHNYPGYQSVITGGTWYPNLKQGPATLFITSGGGTNNVFACTGPAIGSGNRIQIVAGVGTGRIDFTAPPVPVQIQSTTSANMLATITQP